jgi:hypothetical protein
MSKWTDQTADIDEGILSRIVLKNRCAFDFGSAVLESNIRPIAMDSTLSPPLSDSELADIQVAEAEFSSGQAETYENPQDLINALHASRERYRREAGGQ